MKFLVYICMLGVGNCAPQHYGGTLDDAMIETMGDIFERSYGGYGSSEQTAKLESNEVDELVQVVQEIETYTPDDYIEQ